MLELQNSSKGQKKVWFFNPFLGSNYGNSWMVSSRFFFWFRSGSAGIVVFNYKDCNNTLQKTEGVCFISFYFFRNSMSVSFFYLLFFHAVTENCSCPFCYMTCGSFKVCVSICCVSCSCYLRKGVRDWAYSPLFLCLRRGCNFIWIRFMTCLNLSSWYVFFFYSNSLVLLWNSSYSKKNSYCSFQKMITRQLMSL